MRFQPVLTSVFLAVPFADSGCVWAMTGVPAVVLPTIPTNPGDLLPRHTGGDTVSLYSGVYGTWARLAWVAPNGVTASTTDGNCSLGAWTFSDTFVLDKVANDVCKSRGRYNTGPGSEPWCLNGYLVQPPGPRLFGIVGDEIIYRKCSGQTYRWRPPGVESIVPEAASDWMEFRTDEGTHVLQYGTYGQPLGLRVVSSSGSGISLGQVLYPPNGTWTVIDYSLKSDSITVRVARASTGERRIDFFLRSGSTFTLERSTTGGQFGGDIIGVGDRRAAVWSAAEPGKVAVFRMDVASPFIETVFELPNAPDGTNYTSVPSAYARRGSLVCSARWASDTKAAIIIGSRTEQPAPCPGDLNADRTLDGGDIGILLDQWGPATPLSIADINRDGVVNGADLGLVLTNWGSCTP
jgi:hypothetical protein